ncbi:MAG: NDP-sugar synthase [Acidimicrobiia bacterium]|nr:NDP-sugar synthase [Acidimicrobiia bacterium]
MIRHAVLLVGGQGTRLLPLTTATPKALIPLAGEPFVELQLANLVEVGVSDVWLTVGTEHLHVWESYLAQRQGPPQLHLAVEQSPLDTAGGVRAILDELDDRFLILNGDVIFDVPLGSFLSAAPAGGVVLGLARVADPSAYGVVVTTSEGSVERFVEKPPAGSAPADTVNAGIYLAERRLLESFERGPLSFERKVFPDLVAAGELWGVTIEGEWLDIGTAGLYLDAHERLLTGKAGSAPAGSPHLAMAGAQIDGEQRGSWSMIGPGAVVEEGAVVQEAVILDGAVIRSGARVSASIVGWDSHVGERAVISGQTIVGRAARIGPGCRLTDGARVLEGAVLESGAIAAGPTP